MTGSTCPGGGLRAPVEAGGSTYVRTLRELLDSGAVARDDTFLVQFAGEFDQRVTTELGLAHCTFSNLTPAAPSSRLAAGAYAHDAHAMPYPDGSFDHVIGHAGLHHCSRPHEALHEMYRLARRVVVFVENQDSWLMRLAARAGVVGSFELEAVVDGGYTTGGVDGTGVPNHIYRWTRREVVKTIRSFDPARQVPIDFHTTWDMDLQRVASRVLVNKLRLRSDRVARPVLAAASAVLDMVGRGQGNIFAVVVRKDLATWQSWIDASGSGPPELRREGGR